MNAEEADKLKEDEERKKAEEKKKADDRKKKEKEALKQEEEYFKNHESEKQIKEYQRRKKQMSFLAKTIDPVEADCSIHVAGFEIRKKGEKNDYVVYKIDVRFELDDEWKIFRKWKQVADLDLIFKREVKSYQPCLPIIDKQQYGKAYKFNEEFNRARLRGLDQYLQILVNSRAAIFQSKIGSLAFFRFIAPAQLGDIKPPGFVMPFNITS